MDRIKEAPQKAKEVVTKNNFEMVTKVCTRCKQTKKVKEFHKRWNKTPFSHCKECCNESNRRYRAKVRLDENRDWYARMRRYNYFKRYRQLRKQMGWPIKQSKNKSRGPKMHERYRAIEALI